MSDVYGVAEVFRCNRDGTPEFIRTEVQCNGEAMSHADISFLLNEQAETIEVLREWLKDDTSLEHERAIIKMFEDDDWQAPLMGEARHKLAKRRIAALEGK